MPPDVHRLKSIVIGDAVRQGQAVGEWRTIGIGQGVAVRIIGWPRPLPLKGRVA